MANVTDPLARSVHGTDPQNLVEAILRQRIYDNQYWKEHCFGLTAESIIERAVALEYVGGTFSANTKPTPFICLVLKLLQIQPDKEIVYEYIANPDHKYLRALGAMYLRLVGRPAEIYKQLEPLYADFRKIVKRSVAGWEVIHVDEFVDELLTSERCCDIALPHLAKRSVLLEAKLLAPRVSALDGELYDDSQDEENDRGSSNRSTAVQLLSATILGHLTPEPVNSLLKSTSPGTNMARVNTRQHSSESLQRCIPDIPANSACPGERSVSGGEVREYDSNARRSSSGLREYSRGRSASRRSPHSYEKSQRYTSSRSPSHSRERRRSDLRRESTEHDGRRRSRSSRSREDTHGRVTSRRSPRSYEQYGRRKESRSPSYRRDRGRSRSPIPRHRLSSSHYYPLRRSRSRSSTSGAGHHFQQSHSPGTSRQQQRSEEPSHAAWPLLTVNREEGRACHDSAPVAATERRDKVPLPASQVAKVASRLFKKAAFVAAAPSPAASPSVHPEGSVDYWNDMRAKLGLKPLKG
jgi:pre-mRNA-splicing factor 38A